MNGRSLAGRFFLIIFLPIAHDYAPAAAPAGAPGFRSALLAGVQEDSSKAKVVRKKSPNGAMLRSLLFPGWGQLYNHQFIKAALVVAAQGTLVGIAVHYNKRAKKNEPGSDAYEFYIDKRNQTFWFMGGVTLLSMLDAYIDAYLYDFDAGPELELQAGFIENRSSPLIGVTIRARFQ